MAQRRFLEYYATRFPAVELNASFYRLPTEKMLDGWLDGTPGDFRFCVKLSRFITQQKRLKDAADALSVFFDRLAPLGNRMGPVLAQLPPSLAFEHGRVADFLAAYGEVSDFALAIEPRHASWFADEALALMRSWNACLVNADSGGRWPGTDAMTADFGYLRFHGPGELYASGYSPQKLGAVARRAARRVSAGYPVYAFFNNTDGGHAWRNAVKLRELVQRRTGDDGRG